MAKTLDEKIEIARQEKEQKDARLNELLQEKQELDNKAQTDRWCKRASLLEKLIPDTIQLTNEQFKTFIEKTAANDFGRRTLSNLTAKIGVVSEAKAPNTAKQNTPPVSENGTEGSDKSTSKAS